MDMKVIKLVVTRKEARKVVVEAMRELGKGGAIFTTDFYKTRSDNAHRNMPCRLKVTKGLKGGERPYDVNEKDLAPVFDMGTGGSGRGQKCIPVEGVNWIGNKDLRFEFEQVA
jgi:hypothetical protein